tara:strand:+ start:26 stop:1372 length:1347 start_codon:yes stop_codon:yes gene_type:complete
MAPKVATKSSDPSILETLTIHSNVNPSDTVSLADGILELNYIESIMNDTIKVNLSFVDTGASINDKTVMEGLPLVGQEKVVLKFRDNNKNVLGDKPELVLYVNKITPGLDKAQKSVVGLELVSKEYILNEKIRITKRMDGKLSDHIRTILTSQDYLKTEKKVDIEDTINNFNFFGNNKKSLYTINWLSKKGVSAKSQKLGTSAGYFFYETSEGFFFKSIDSLLDQEPKTKMIYNETPDTRGSNIPEGYDQKILRFQKSNAVNVQEKLKMGSYSNRVVLFDPFTCFYEVKTNDTDRTQDSLKKGGKELSLSDSRNKEFDIPGNNKEFSRTQYFLLDKGTAPTGNADQQIEKSGEENFEYGQIANQSMMRYNQLYAMRASITIAGNFSLHAGDAIFIDSPGLQKKNTSDVDRRDGGLYIITDICHKIDGTGTYTQCNLARDSFGRKPITR